MTDAAYGLEVLAFGPHPDDVELFCGGLLASMALRGYRTGVVDLTRGEMGTRGTVETRAAETDAASRALGLTHRENLGLPDAGLRLEEAHVLKLAEALRRLRPELVLLPWERERHPDHEATSALVTRALFLAGLRKLHTTPDHPAFTPRQVLHYVMRVEAEPCLVVDVTAGWERKMAAVRCHASQVEPRPDAPVTLVASPLALPALEARDRFYGARVGAAFGEPYVLKETLGLADPVDHFRRNALGRPFTFPARP